MVRRTIRHKTAIPPQFVAYVPTTDTFIRIPFGTSGGGIPANIDSQKAADDFNERQSISPYMVEAAVHCALNDTWHDFEKAVGWYAQYPHAELWSRRQGGRIITFSSPPKGFK